MVDLNCAICAGGIYIHAIFQANMAFNDIFVVYKQTHNILVTRYFYDGKGIFNTNVMLRCNININD